MRVRKSWEIVREKGGYCYKISINTIQEKVRNTLAVSQSADYNLVEIQYEGEGKKKR